MSIPHRLVLLVISLAALAGGLSIALAHPLAPLWATLVFLGLIVLFVWQPRLGLVAVPAFLPLLNFSPWTGWLIVDEFDLLVLAVVAAGYLQMQGAGSGPQRGDFFPLLLIVVLLIAALGTSNLALPDLDGFAGYDSPLNRLRVGKSLLWGALLFPLLARVGSRSSAGPTTAGFSCACVLGSVWIILAACWERGFYPGWFEFSTPYRTVALFWEMHLGGAALDAYLVLIAPLLVWAWQSVSTPVLRFTLGIYIQAYVYVCLTTYSRGVLGAIAGSMVLLSALLLKQRGRIGQAAPVFKPSSIFMLLLVALEVVLVLGSDSFMNRRLAESERDFGNRLQHWSQGIGLLKTPQQWLLGIGLGSLPAQWASDASGPVLSGASYSRRDNGLHTMVLEGPDDRAGDNNSRKLGGLYALSQRVDLVSGQRYLFAMDVRGKPGTEMMVQVCAMHLLYPGKCQTRRIRLDSDGWQHWESALFGYAFKLTDWQSLGHGVFALSVLTPGAKVEMSNLQLSAGGGDLLRNAQFQHGGAAWFPTARSYFLPWHIDNLYLEILIETGLIGLSAFLAFVYLLARRLIAAFGQGLPLAAYFLSCIAGLLALGLLVSVLDMPRVATLLALMLLWAWRYAAPERECETSP